MVMAFASSFGNCSSNFAEAKAALFGVQWYITNGFSNIILECDSLLIINMLNGYSKPPWHLLEIVLKTKNYINMANVIIQHGFREVNQVADALAKWSIENPDHVFTSVNTLSQGANWDHTGDLMQMASLRHKHRKNRFL
ncbi:uncharacterized protein LOC142175879 [Nicotiana tabacum]|uniref:Uncharacterized protein LOC142175879 n=1 Tax=Nicotiana tabacum TaxID=4097 RepID=A0AC58TP32_TOBAC